MRGIIIYKSKYGSTRQYAEWLREETGFELCEAAQCPDDLRPYDVVVIGSRVFAGHIAQAKWISGHWPALQGKRVFVMLTNIITDAEKAATVLEQSLPAEIASHLAVFPVGGRYTLQRMNFLDRLLIKMLAGMTKDAEMKAGLLTDRDYLDRQNLRDLLAAIRAAE